MAEFTDPMTEESATERWNFWMAWEMSKPVIQRVKHGLQRADAVETLKEIREVLAEMTGVANMSAADLRGWLRANAQIRVDQMVRLAAQAG